MKVLVTGGAGFIGSTVASACLDAGHVPVILDDFSTGARAFVRDRIHYDGDIGDARLLRRITAEHPDVAAVVHCAAHIIVPESTALPLRYYDNNVARSIGLLQNVIEVGIERILFSSSAAIYAPGPGLAVDETSPVAPSNPYAASKAIVERVLADVARTGAIRALSLRYFNPIGADPSRRTGLQLARPTHVLGKLIEAHDTGRPFVIAGTDWPTPDGTGIRDYIHVWDLARAHVRALECFDEVVVDDDCEVINLGTGAGTTVRELVTLFDTVTRSTLTVHEGPRRPGDVAGSYTRIDKARSVLGWRPEYTVADGVRDALDWSRVRAERLGAG